MNDPNAPEWAKPGLDDPDAEDAPRFQSSLPPKEMLRHEVGCACLACLLIRLRMTLRAEAPSKLHTHAAPVLRDHEGIPERDGDVEGTGLAFTAQFHRYLSHPDAWGLSRLGMLSIIEVSEACAVRHPTHRRPMFTRTICGELAFQAAYLGQEVGDLCWLHPELDIEQISGMLTWGLRHAEQFRLERFAQWSKIPGEDAPFPERRPFRSVA